MRFHFGVSFRLKTLKKFLFPILIGILAYFGFGGLFGCIKVNALVNSNTFYNLDVDESDFTSIFESQFYTDMSYKEVLDYFSNYDSEYFNVVVWSYNSESDIYLNLFPKDFTLRKGIYGNNNGLSFYGGPSVSVRNYSVVLFKRSYTMLESNIFNLLKTCLDTNNCTANASGDGIISYNSNTNAVNRNLLYFNESMSLENDMSYNLSNYSLGTFLYYSQAPFLYDLSDSGSSYYFGKSLYLNNKTYTTDVEMFSYTSLFDNSLNKVFDSIDRIYVGSIPKDQINNFKIDLSFHYLDVDYVHSLEPYILYYGRKDNNGYYSYENIVCNSSTLFEKVYNSEKEIITSSLLPNGFNCNDINDYDYIYLYIQMLGEGNSKLQDLSITSNYGNLTILDSSKSSGLHIYEKLYNQNSSFSYLLSTNDFKNVAYYISDSKYTILTDVFRKDNNRINQVNYNPLEFGLYNNTNAILFNLSNVYNGITNLDLFLNENTIISSSNNNSYYYYDDTGQIVNNNIVNKLIVNFDDSYDVSYYFGQVSSFVDSLSLSINQFSIIIQNFYDSMPSVFQLFLLVGFILVCTYFTFLLIRK